MDKSMSMSRQPLLETDQIDRTKDEGGIGSIDDYVQGHVHSGQQSSSPAHSFLILFHIFLILTYTSLFAYLTRKSLNATCFESKSYYCKPL